jgi:hypothetical protein
MRIRTTPKYSTAIPAHFFNSLNWYSGGWSPIGSTRHCGHQYAYCANHGWLWWWRNWCNDDWQGKPNYSKKTSPSATLSNTNTTCSTRMRTRAAAMGTQRLTAWAMALPLTAAATVHIGSLFGPQYQTGNSVATFLCRADGVRSRYIVKFFVVALHTWLQLVNSYSILIISALRHSADNVLKFHLLELWLS